MFVDGLGEITFGQVFQTDVERRDNRLPLFLLLDPSLFGLVG